jgi:signal transduction histidine kinase
MQREDRGLTPQSREDFNTILRNGRHLLHLIDEILDFKKIEAGRMEICPAPLSLKRLIREAVRIITPLIGKKRIRLTTTLPPRLPAVVTDGLRLKQVLINLLENSLKFTEKGCLRLAVQPAKPPGDTVNITIRDTGIGIPRTKLKSIFRKFEQGEAGPTRKYGGAGLGLTISRSIMRSLGGDITVKSALKKGSEFCVTLPLHPVPAGALKKKRKAIS